VYGTRFWHERGDDASEAVQKRRDKTCENDGYDMAGGEGAAHCAPPVMSSIGDQPPATVPTGLPRYQ
jgi:hypothetical protein